MRCRDFLPGTRAAYGRAHVETKKWHDDVGRERIRELALFFFETGFMLFNGLFNGDVTAVVHHSGAKAQCSGTIFFTYVQFMYMVGIQFIAYIVKNSCQKLVYVNLSKYTV